MNTNDVQFSFSTEEIVKRQAAAITFQRIYRGKKVRDMTVLPSQIVEYLQRSLLYSYCQNRLREIAIILCRYINEMAINTSLYLGKSITLRESDSKLYHLPLFDQNKYKGSHSVFLEINCWLEMTNRRKIEILISPQKKELLGTGVRKEILRAQNLVLWLFKRKQKRPISLENYVQVRISNKAPHFVSKGNLIQKELWEIGLPGLHIASPMIEQLPDALVKNTSKRFKMVWYQSSLWNAVKKGGIYPNLDNKSLVRKLNCHETFMAIKNISETLDIIHSKGFIHRDIKSANILLNIDSDNSIKTYLIDFDLSLKINDTPHPIVCDYIYWDKSTQKGWTTPLCDWYGLAITMGESLFEGFKSVRDKKEKLDKKYKLVLLKEYFKTNLNNENHSALEACTNPKDIEKLFNKLKLNHTDVSLVTHFERLKKELHALTRALNFIHEIMQQSNLAYEFLEKNVDLQNKLLGNNIEERKAAIASILRHCPAIHQFTRTISGICKKLEGVK